MEKHPYDQLIETVADKMKEYEDDNLRFGIFEKVDKDLGLSRGTAWDASGWKDYCDIGFGDVWELTLGAIRRTFWDSPSENRPWDSKLLHFQMAVGFPLFILTLSPQLNWPLQLYCLKSSNYFRLYILDPAQKLQKKEVCFQWKWIKKMQVAG